MMNEKLLALLEKLGADLDLLAGMESDELLGCLAGYGCTENAAGEIVLPDGTATGVLVAEFL